MNESRAVHWTAEKSFLNIISIGTKHYQCGHLYLYEATLIYKAAMWPLIGPAAAWPQLVGDTDMSISGA